MNTRNIAAVLKDRGYETYTSFTDAGIVLGILMPDDKMLCSLVPIDDESDMRFCDFMEEEARKYDRAKLKCELLTVGVEDILLLGVSFRSSDRIRGNGR